MTDEKYNFPDIRYKTKKKPPKDNEKRVMLSIKESTKDRLEEIGKMTDTFDILINRLIDEWIKTHK